MDTIRQFVGEEVRLKEGEVPVKENFEIVQNSLIVDDYLYKTHLE